MRGNEKQQLIIMVVAFVAVILGEGAFAYYCLSERGEINTALAALAKEEQDAQRKIEQIPKLTEESRELAQVIGEYARILPREDEVREDAFLEDIGRFSRDAEIKVIRAEPLKQKALAKSKSKVAVGKNTFVRHSYRFELEGTFLQFLKFVNKIENHPRFLRVDEISIDSSVEKGQRRGEVELAENPVKSIQLVISTYTYSKSTEEVR